MFFLIFYWFLGIGQWCCDGGVVPLFFFFLCHNNNSTWTLLKFAHILFSEFFGLLGHAHEYNLLVMSFAITSFFVPLSEWHLILYKEIEFIFTILCIFFDSPFRLLFYHFWSTNLILYFCSLFCYFYVCCARCFIKWAAAGFIFL